MPGGTHVAVLSGQKRRRSRLQRILRAALRL
jgi:hypothetical protein